MANQPATTQYKMQKLNTKKSYCESLNVRFEADTEMTMKVTIVWHMRSCSLAEGFTSSFTDKAGIGLEAHQH